VCTRIFGGNKMKRQLIVMICLLFGAISAHGQGTAFTSYSGDDDTNLVGPGTTRWVTSTATCTASPYYGRAVGLSLRQTSTCTSPFQSFMEPSTYWNPNGPPNTNWRIEGMGYMVRNSDNSYVQDIAYFYSECDIPSDPTPLVADVVAVYDTWNGC